METENYMTPNSENFKILNSNQDITIKFASLTYNAKERLDGFGPTSGYPLMLQSEVILRLLTFLRREGKSLRYITEINKDNLEICKLMKNFIDLRHIDKIEGGLMINDDECMIMIKSKEIDHASSPTLLYSNSQSLVKQQQMGFDAMWDKAVPASQRIKLMDGNYPLNNKEDTFRYEFSHVVADRLRNPLQSIMGFSRLLISKKINKNDLRKYASIIDSNSQVLARRIDQVISYLDIEYSTSVLCKQNFDLLELINKTILHTFGEESRSKYSVHCEFGAQKVILNADKKKIEIVINSLLTNASEYFQGKDVVIAISKGKITTIGHHLVSNCNCVIVSITDKGNGIDRDISQELFSKFSTTSTKNLGIDLYISKKIVEEHGGKIWAQNNNDKDGKGATISFSLPMINDTIINS
ncbi:MAG: sensor histidine kinase [Candidatus Nitrosocosmicus sp.]